MRWRSAGFYYACAFVTRREVAHIFRGSCLGSERSSSPKFHLHISLTAKHSLAARLANNKIPFVIRPSAAAIRTIEKRQHATGRSIPSCKRRRRLNPMLSVRGILLTKCNKTPVMAPIKVPKATPIAPSQMAPAMLHPRLTIPSPSGEMSIRCCYPAANPMAAYGMSVSLTS